MTSVNLGELREGRPDCPSDLALDDLATNEASPEEAAALRGHIEACSHCTERMAVRRQGFDAFPALDADRPLRALHAFRAASERPKRDERLRRRRVTVWSFMAGSVAAAAVLAIVMLRDRTGSPPDPTLEPQDVRIKGAFALHVFRQKGQGAEEMVSGEGFRPGDNLRFVVDLPRPGHISIFGVDPKGQKYVAWPLPQHQAEQKLETRRAPGKGQELAGGVTLDDSVGEESLYLVECGAAAELAQCQPDKERTKLRCPTGCSVFPFTLRKGP